MTKYEVKLLTMNSWNKIVSAKSKSEAVAKAEKQAYSWERKKWAYHVMDVSEPEVYEVHE
jgi:hypothetical protein